MPFLGRAFRSFDSAALDYSLSLISHISWAPGRVAASNLLDPSMHYLSLRNRTWIKLACFAVVSFSGFGYAFLINQFSFYKIVERKTSMMHCSKRRNTHYWQHHLRYSWVVNSVLLPLAIGLLCSYLAHWMK